MSCGVFLMRYAGSLPSHDPHYTTCGTPRRTAHPSRSLSPHRLLPLHSVDGVRSTFARYGLLDDTVHFLKGFFHDTLPPAVESGACGRRRALRCQSPPKPRALTRVARAGEIDSLAVIRLDGDTYESTITALEPLYPRLSLGASPSSSVCAGAPLTPSPAAAQVVS